MAGFNCEKKESLVTWYGQRSWKIFRSGDGSVVRTGHGTEKRRLTSDDSERHEPLVLDRNHSVLGVVSWRTQTPVTQGAFWSTDKLGLGADRPLSYKYLLTRNGELWLWNNAMCGLINGYMYRNSSSRITGA